MKTRTKGFYIMPAIPPHCKEVRTPATFLRDLGNGRILLRDDSISAPGKDFWIETGSDNFVPNSPECGHEEFYQSSRQYRHSCGSLTDC